MTQRSETPLDYDATQPIREVHHYHASSNDNGSFDKLVKAVLPLAVAALVAAVWQLSVAVAELKVNVKNLSDIIHTPSK